MKYFLFIQRKKEREQFLQEFGRIKANREAGKSPVYNELRCSRTNIVESIPYNILNAVFVAAGTLILRAFHIGNLLSIAIVLVINNFCGALSNYIFYRIKHKLRCQFLQSMGLESNEDNIAVLESMEYQTV